MKMLVIGREGQLARSLMAVAPAHGIFAEAIGRPDCDVLRPETMADAVDGAAPELVVNAAAYTAVDKAEAEPELAMAINAHGPGQLAEVCARRGIPIVHISTDYVFDGRKPAPYVERDATSPLGVYGRSKIAGEIAVRAANPRSLIVRTAWVHSPYGGNFVKTMLRLADARDVLRVVDDQHGSPTYAPHLADAICRMARAVRTGPVAENAGAPWGVYHVAGRGETTWCGLARDVFARSARCGGPTAQVEAITTAEYPTPAARPANSRLDCSKLHAQFGIVMPDWRTGVAECVARLTGSQAARPSAA